MTNRLNSAVGTAKGVVESAAAGAGVAATTAKTTVFDVAKAVVGVAATVGALGFDDVLGWVGLSRKRSPLTALGLFGAGVAVGAGAALLLSPTSGEALRRELLTRLDGLKRQATRGVERAERKVEDKVGAAVDAVKGAVAPSETSSANSHYSIEGAGRAHGESGHHLS
ncbi:YtxH domain-containing protein [Sorangium sp. So ce1000]|uniref:YtxH domain-containing protein n=1 Tax=Sorangium sp. So ce1000 TaxID=3133325 RepID=UPI003F5F4628